ncbi:DUF4193 family protein [Sinomonas atrocyanea]|uniref:DUF4193 family protein n=1 Tax=Sinomonas atrocyanea TaxID=37927 RepID=UPI002782BB1D|nr:DUF4193 family protein [Sinomonas atrocyanea]MDQ0261344.1 hypothetical protein [Sinomonas atrocyanea]MDR6622958.1 hypothetical protein [Sinomonas atrocyanea]
MAADYDELRSDVKESQNESLEALKSASAPDPRSVVRELDGDDSGEDTGLPGGEFVNDELTVHVIPQGADEFVCQSCFLVRHRSQRAVEVDGVAYCRDCEG